MTAKNTMHPGEFLSEAYLKPNGISINKAAECIGVSPSTISRLIKGDFDLTSDMAVKLSYLCGNTVEQWMNLQMNYSISKAYEKHKGLTLEETIMCVDDAWEKALKGNSVYFSADEVSSMMKCRAENLKKHK